MTTGSLQNHASSHIFCFFSLSLSLTAHQVLQGLIHILYHFDRRFSHMSQATVNWTSAVFHSGSQPAVNFISNQDTIFSVHFRPFWGQNWAYFAFRHTNFRPWTWSNSVHDRHRSHPVNLRSKWYSMPRAHSHQYSGELAPNPTFVKLAVWSAFCHCILDIGFSIGETLR